MLLVFCRCFVLKAVRHRKKVPVSLLKHLWKLLLWATDAKEGLSVLSFGP